MINIDSQEFQDRFRNSLQTSNPAAWLTLRLLESNGLAVRGYASGSEVVLNVGIPPTENKEFNPAFTLRSTDNNNKLAWRFSAIAHLGNLPEDLTGKI